MRIKRRRPDDNEFRFDDIYDTALRQEFEETSRVPQFRMSSAPFCSIRTVFEWMEYLKNVGTWSFRSDFYTGIGTVTHSNLQKWLPRVAPGVILGNWRCIHCCKHSLESDCVHCTNKCKTFRHALVGPQYCPECGAAMQYQEFQYLLTGVPASGHSDGILLFDVPKVLGIEKIEEKHIELINKLLRSKDRAYTFPAYVLEYKTISSGRALHLLEPIPHHRAQATMYASAGRDMFPSKYKLINLDVKGILIKYISRDRPDIRSRDFKIDVPDDDYYTYNVNMIRRSIQAFKKKDSDLIIPKNLPCTPKGKYNIYYHDCPHADICKDCMKDKSLLKKYMKKVQPYFIQELKNFKEKFNHP
jgi:hypothetical protein